MTPLALLRRVGQAVLVLFLAYTAAYILLAALPGDAIMARYGAPELGLTNEQIAEIRASYGVDRPLVLRYLDSIWAFVRGDFGYSVQSGAKVSDLLAESLPSSLTLAAVALAGSVFLAVVIAFTASYGKGVWLRRLFRNIPPFFISLPVFWVGIMLIQVVSFQLGLIPVIGASEAESLVLPALTLMVPIAAPLAQVFLRSIDEVREQPFVAVAKARGASTSWLLWRNVAPNALLPVMTMAGLLFGELIGGAIVTEAVFGRTGVGNLTAQAVANRDTPVLLAVVVIATVMFVTINLIVDLLYPVLDARLRQRSGGGSGSAVPVIATAAEAGPTAADTGATATQAGPHIGPHTGPHTEGGPR